MKKIFFLLIPMLTLTALAEPKPFQVLKQREPNWRSEVVQTYPNGGSKVIIFFEPLDVNKERDRKSVV